MFDQLSERIQGALSKLGNVGVIKESHIEEALRDVRMALLEADVHIDVVRTLLAKLKAQVVGTTVAGSNSPAQQFIKVVHDELVAVLGGTTPSLNFRGSTPHVIVLVGLQGSGKTTSCSKLALHYRNKGRRPFLVPVDIHRPAAVEQLKTLARQIDIPVYDTNIKTDPVKTVKAALDEAVQKFCDVVIVDTAGRTHVDHEMMDELGRIVKKIDQPHILFVADAMTGQEAVRVAKTFHEQVKLDGVILTKLDGDAKGGAALSIRHVIGCPILFVGMGEKASAFEPFHPDRLVSRLLDYGDLMTLAEKASEVIDADQAESMAKKLVRNEFDLEDFRQQMRQMKKLGSMTSLMKYLPGAKNLTKNLDMDVAERELKRKESIINSMTMHERRKPNVLNGSRRQRIALGSGVSVAEINRFMREYDQMKAMMKQLSKGGGGMMNMLKGMMQKGG